MLYYLANCSTEKSIFSLRHLRAFYNLKELIVCHIKRHVSLIKFKDSHLCILFFFFCVQILN